MNKIEIKGMKFFAYHGFYPEEQVKGNHFEVDIILTVDFLKAAQSDNITHTVNYELVYKLCAKLVLESRRKLMETLCLSIAQETLKLDQDVRKVKVRVSKLTPPLPGQVERFTVEMSLKNPTRTKFKSAKK